MKRVFADASHFIGLLNPRDEIHARARSQSLTPNTVLVTTPWVLAEVGAFFSRPLHRRSSSP
jgi:hypothetical protein